MAKQIEKLTALKVRRACRPGRLGDGAGLYLQITPSGSRSWIFRYERLGREHYIGLGPLHTVSLVEARHAAQQARKSLLQNIDPLARKRQRRRRPSIRPEHKRFDACAEQYIKEHAAGWHNDKHRQQWSNTMRDYVYPHFGAIDVRKVDTAEIVKALRPIWTTKTETATRVRERIERVLDWATVHQYREGSNPARWRGHLEVLLPPPAKLKSVRHHAALPFEDVAQFMAALQGQRGLAAQALEFTILTACRSGEVLKLTWTEIDLERGTWTLPAERTKAGRAHRVPLSAAALKVLAAQKGWGGRYVFPGGTEDGTLSSVAMTKVLERMGFGGVTVHGFRSTFRDWVAERTRYPREWAEISGASRWIRDGNGLFQKRLVGRASRLDGRLGGLGSSGQRLLRRCKTTEARTSPPENKADHGRFRLSAQIDSGEPFNDGLEFCQRSRTAPLPRLSLAPRSSQSSPAPGTHHPR